MSCILLFLRLLIRLKSYYFFMTIPKEQTIQHIGFIMDGNRRWAKQNGLPTYKGHEEGFLVAKRIIEEMGDLGVKYCTFYTLSSENLVRRDVDEIKFLMKLIIRAFTQHLKEFHQNNVRLLVSGRVDELSEEVQRAIKKGVRLTKNNTKAVVNLALNYGGRAELMDAIRQMVANNIPMSKIDEETLAQYLYGQGELPDPDLIIRTGGQKRLSNFLPWQSVYSELYFTDALWPDFDSTALKEAIDEYHARQRNFGK